MPSARHALVRLVALAVVFAPSLAAASTLDPQDRRFVSVEVLKADAEDEFASGLSSAWQIEAGIPLENDAILELTAPFAYATPDGGDTDHRSFTVGNPGVRIRRGGPGERFGYDFTVRAPFSNGDAFVPTLQGLRSVLVDEPERFVVDVLPATLGVTGDWPLVGDTVFLRGRLEGSLWIDTGDREDATELYVRPTLGVLIRGDAATARLALRAAHWLTADGSASFDDATQQEAVLDVEFEGQSVRPAATVRVSLDDDLDPLAQLVFGLRITVLRD